jgi:IS30 family transposase
VTDKMGYLTSQSIRIIQVIIHQHFNAKERHTLMFLLQWNLSFRAIGRYLKKHHTTISRVVKRNSQVAGYYCGDSAEQSANKRRPQYPPHLRRYSNALPNLYVIDKLKNDWSPEIISRRLKVDFPRSKKAYRRSKQTQ